MTVIKITLARFLLSYLLICLNWKYALGLDVNFTLAFLFCLINEIAFSTISTLILAGTKKLFGVAARAGGSWVATTG
ncbi:MULTISPECIES: hypothetical protein [Leptospira]|uniref:hypothetical protein n=1 Tax=Leptospira TaxID=171 RepID=UPI0003687DB7|nr:MULTISPECIES: hypothetical protein [Leptospira]OMI12930.1 hypothetical protein BUQ74_21090 [Leptospira weilii serovar Heyan]QDK23895.1 hypothetical protein FHG67_15100 [Leptospira weilii]QDK26468.1 hypothetical protein FHG68_07160 [Leptospira weilii]ULH28821.1 hypothetical protein FH586_02385 [Leptospira weilii]